MINNIPCELLIDPVCIFRDINILYGDYIKTKRAGAKIVRINPNDSRKPGLRIHHQKGDGPFISYDIRPGLNRRGPKFDRIFVWFCRGYGNGRLFTRNQASKQKKKERQHPNAQDSFVFHN